MGKLHTQVDLKILVIYELTRISKEKDKSTKEWEEQCTRDAASHNNEIKNLTLAWQSKQSK